MSTARPSRDRSIFGNNTSADIRRNEIRSILNDALQERRARFRAGERFSLSVPVPAPPIPIPLQSNEKDEFVSMDELEDENAPDLISIRIISLERDEQRRQHVVDKLLPALSSASTNVQIFSAVDGRSPLLHYFMRENQVSFGTDQTFLRRCIVTMGMPACLMSHFLVWKEFANSDASKQWMVILEDDASIDSTNFARSLRRIVHLWTHAHRTMDVLYLHLPYQSPGSPNGVKRVTSPVYSLAGYMISKQTAMRLVNEVRRAPVNDAVDGWLAGLIVRRILSGWALSPPIVDCIGQKTGVYKGESFHSNIWNEQRMSQQFNRNAKALMLAIVGRLSGPSDEKETEERERLANTLALSKTYSVVVFLSAQDFVSLPQAFKVPRQGKALYLPPFDSHFNSSLFSIVICCCFHDHCSRVPFSIYSNNSALQRHYYFPCGEQKKEAVKHIGEQGQGFTVICLDELDKQSIPFLPTVLANTLLETIK